MKMSEKVIAGILVGIPVVLFLGLIFSPNNPEKVAIFFLVIALGALAGRHFSKRRNRISAANGGAAKRGEVIPGISKKGLPLSFVIAVFVTLLSAYFLSVFFEFYWLAGAWLFLTAYIYHCYLRLQPAKLGLVLRQEGRTNVVLLEGGHFVWAFFETVELIDQDKDDLKATVEANTAPAEPGALDETESPKKDSTIQPGPRMTSRASIQWRVSHKMRDQQGRLRYRENEPALVEKQIPAFVNQVMSDTMGRFLARDLAERKEEFTLAVNCKIRLGRHLHQGVEEVQKLFAEAVTEEEAEAKEQNRKVKTPLLPLKLDEEKWVDEAGDVRPLFFGLFYQTNALAIERYLRRHGGKEVSHTEYYTGTEIFQVIIEQIDPSEAVGEFQELDFRTNEVKRNAEKLQGIKSEALGATLALMDKSKHITLTGVEGLLSALRGGG